MLPHYRASMLQTLRAKPAKRTKKLMEQSWKPSAAIKASAALHLGAAVALGAGVAWPWCVGAVAANHLVLTGAGLWPRSSLLGHNQQRLSQAACQAKQIAITIDDGPDPQVTPAVLDVLDEAGAKASFFCIGQRVEAHPELAREIVRRGHQIENHSYAHRHTFSMMGMGGLQKEISRAQTVIESVTGRKPQYFRAPAGLRSPLLDPVLQRLGLTLVSWKRRGFDTVSREPALVLNRLTQGLSAGDILLLHDGHSARAQNGRAVILEVLPGLLQTAAQLQLSAVRLDQAL
jgi:peptidoglycan-N-acetylglucosamine deacetylase